MHYSEILDKINALSIEERQYLPRFVNNNGSDMASCPRCKHYNAMIPTPTGVAYCRDCDLLAINSAHEQEPEAVKAYSNELQAKINKANGQYTTILTSEYESLISESVRAGRLDNLVVELRENIETLSYKNDTLKEANEALSERVEQQAEEIIVLSQGIAELAGAVRQAENDRDEVLAQVRHAFENITQRFTALQSVTVTPFEQIYHDITVTPEPFGDGVIVSDKFKPRALFPNESYEGSEVYEIAEANYLQVNDTDLGNGTTILEIVQCFHEQGDARQGRQPECDLTDGNHETICELIDNENADRFILMQEDNTVGYYDKTPEPDEEPSEGIKAHNERVNTVTGRLRPEQDLFPEDGVDLAMIQNRADENGLSLRTTEKATFTIIEVFQCHDHDRDGRNCAEGDAYDDDDHEKLCELRNDWGGHPNLFYLEDRPTS